MARLSVVFLVAVVTLLAIADADQGRSSQVKMNHVGTYYNIDGDRNMMSSATTSAAIQAAFDKGNALTAAATGAKAALTATYRSTAMKTFDKIGGRKMLRTLLDGSAERSDRVVMASIASSDMIAKAVSASTGSIKKATTGSLAYAKLASKNSARATEFSP